MPALGRTCGFTSLLGSVGADAVMRSVRQRTMSPVTLLFNVSLLGLHGWLHGTYAELKHISIVSSDSIEFAKGEAKSRLKRGPGKYERWERLHESIKSALSKIRNSNMGSRSVTRLLLFR